MRQQKELKVICVGKPSVKNMPKEEYDVFLHTLYRSVLEYFQTEKSGKAGTHARVL